MGQENLYNVIQAGRKINPNLTLFSTGPKGEKATWYIQLCLCSHRIEPVLSNLILGPAHLEHEPVKGQSSVHLNDARFNQGQV